MKIIVCDGDRDMGQQAAAMGAAVLRSALQKQEEVVLILATGISQFAMLAALAAAEDIDWSRVTTFHLDEYIGLLATHPASFRRFLRERFVNHLPIPLRAFHGIDGETDPVAECRHLNTLLGGREVALAFMGIGVNGHLAFNDPPADFQTRDPYIIVDLDDACRNQQLGEGWFPTLDAVPKRAISMSIQQIMKSQTVICLAPGARKAEVVRETVTGQITPRVPSTVLRLHPDTALYLDTASASRLDSLSPAPDSSPSLLASV